LNSQEKNYLLHLLTGLSFDVLKLDVLDRARHNRQALTLTITPLFPHPSVLTKEVVLETKDIPPFKYHWEKVFDVTP
jgi:hypothetical protein